MSRITDELSEVAVAARGEGFDRWAIVCEKAALRMQRMEKHIVALHELDASDDDT